MISIGIDISKGKSTVCIVKPYGEVLKAPYEVAHTEEELYCFCAVDKKLFECDKAFFFQSAEVHLPDWKQHVHQAYSRYQLLADYLA